MNEIMPFCYDTIKLGERDSIRRDSGPTPVPVDQGNGGSGNEIDPVFLSQANSKHNRWFATNLKRRPR